MHSFVELVDRSTRFSLNALKEAEDQVSNALQTSATTNLVKSLQMVQLQRAIIAVGMFSMLESILQDRLDCDNGFVGACRYLEREGEHEIKKTFLFFIDAINVLKHGRGRSYESLLASADALPFRIKRHDEGFFLEGDTSEISTLIEVDDEFVFGCTDVIRSVSNVINKVCPGLL